MILKKDGSPDKRFKQNTSVNTQPIQRQEEEKAEYTYKVNPSMNIIYFKNKLQTAVTSLSIAGTNISCGVRQLANISSVGLPLKFGIPRSIILNAMKDFIEQTKVQNRSAYLVSSNNNIAKESNSIMDELALNKSDWRKNPNSGRNIKLWIL